MENLTAEEIAALTHWSTYGQRGTTPDHRVTPLEWRNEPFASPAEHAWHVNVEPHQLPLLLLGFLPRLADHRIKVDPAIFVEGEIMTTHIFVSGSTRKDVSASEDKWFVYADGPDADGEVRLHLHRSWTGTKQIELVIDAGRDGYGKDGNGASVRSIIYETDPERAQKDANAERYKETAREVCWWVLNVRLGPEDMVMETLLGQLQLAERNPGKAYRLD